MAVRTPQAPHPPGFLPPDPRVEEPYWVTPQMAIRIAILGVLAITIFCALFFRLWALQVISGDRYLENAQNNQIRSFRAAAPRGSIVDRNGQVLVSNEPGTLVQIWPAALEAMPVNERNTMLRRLSRLLEIPFKDVRRSVRERAASDPLTPVPVKTDVGDLRAAYLMEHQADFPGIQISQTYLRNYEQGAIAAQILGYVSEISAEQV
jgi:penicillin-binding protein 2